MSFAGLKFTLRMVAFVEFHQVLVVAQTKKKIFTGQ